MASRAFGFGQEMALFVRERCHAVQIGHVGSGVLGCKGQAQHAGRVAQVEEQVLAELEGSQVARVRMHLIVEQAERSGDVVRCPGPHRTQEAQLSLTRRYAASCRALEVRPRVDRTVGRFGEQVQCCDAGLHDDAVVVLGRSEDVRYPGFAGDEPADEVVDRGYARRVGEMDLIA